MFNHPTQSFSASSGYEASWATLNMTLSCYLLARQRVRTIGKKSTNVTLDRDGIADQRGRRREVARFGLNDLNRSFSRRHRLMVKHRRERENPS
jgi:hypothetical protein